MKKKDIINRVSKILSECVVAKNYKLDEVAVKYFLNYPEKGYNVYYCVVKKDDENISSLGFSSFDLGEDLVEKRLLLNKSPFKKKNAAMQFASYKSKEYSVFFNKNNLSVSNISGNGDFIEVVDEN